MRRSIRCFLLCEKKPKYGKSELWRQRLTKLMSNLREECVYLVNHKRQGFAQGGDTVSHKLNSPHNSPRRNKKLAWLLYWPTS